MSCIASASCRVKDSRLAYVFLPTVTTISLLRSFIASLGVLLVRRVPGEHPEDASHRNPLLAARAPLLAGGLRQGDGWSLVDNLTGLRVEELRGPTLRNLRV